ncbi:MAG: MarR family winged helix-turn-helix transcriptional regulator, partial [Burkholderiaceae bacterium]
KPHGLKHTEWRILALTDELGQASLTQIVEQVVIERTTIGKLIDRMVAMGWLLKGKSATDARTMQVSLSPAGLRVLQATAPAMRELMMHYASVLSASEYQRLTVNLRTYGRQVGMGLPPRLRM